MATEDFFAVEQLAIAGNVDAQCALGGFYDHGLEGVTKNYQEAVKWYRKAADQGNKEAQYFLGICYQLGKSVNKNNEEAAKWYRKASSQGHANAKEALDWLINEGLISTAPSSTSNYTPPKPAPSSTSSSWDLCCQGMTAYNAKNYSKAVELWRKAEEMGDTLAVHKNFYSYSLNNQGLAAYNTKDYAKAVELWKKAADMGQTYAMNNLGSCYALGQGVPQDKAKTIEWKTKAANLGNADAQYSLGTYYESGNSITKDEKKAIELYKKAAAQGNAQAQKKLTDRGIKW